MPDVSSSYGKRTALIDSLRVDRSERLRLQGQRIQEIRRKRGMTQDAVARELGITKDAMSRIERGVNGTTVENLHRLAAILSVDVAEFFRPMLAKAGMQVSGEDPSLRDVPVGSWRGRRPTESTIRDASHPRPGPHLRFEVPPEEFIEGDFDYPQTYRGGAADVIGGVAAGPFDDIDTSGEMAEVLNPTLRDVQSGRFGVVRVKGRSMEPRLHDGDLVLLDTFDKKIAPKRIMAVYRRGEGSAFGYVHKIGDLTILTKANPEFSPIVLTDDVIIQGVVKKRLEETLE
jgi:transcriptional regulator with XRE-family HTH domain